MADHEDYLPGEAPAAHKTTHQDGGADEVNIEGLTGITSYMAAHILLPTVHQDAPALILTHKGDASAHHAKYTDAAAVAALYAALPSFHACVNAEQTDVTGDATPFDITGAFWTEIVDHLGNFNEGVFTAPISGLYLFTSNLLLSGLEAAHDYGQLQLVTSNRTYLLLGANMGAMHYSGYLYNVATLLADMDEGDTAYLCLTVIDGAKTVDIRIVTYFSGALIQC